MTTKNLLVELFVEELPPKALKKLGESFGREIRQGLIDLLLVIPEANWTWFATPRRLAVHICDVEPKQRERVVTEKILPVSVALDLHGNPTPALLKKLAAKNIDVTHVPFFGRQMDGKTEVLVRQWTDTGFHLSQVMGDVLERAFAKLPIPKVMTYQLTDGWTDVKFVRPAHGLVILHGADILEGVRTSDNQLVLGLEPSRETRGHRFEAVVDPLVLDNADVYVEVLKRDGAVIASFAERKAEIARQLAAAASKVGGGVTAIEDDALLDEVTALVERPNVLICEFEKEYLDVPQE